MAAFERKRQPKAIKGVEIVLLFSTMFDHKSAASATHFALICSKKMVEMMLSMTHHYYLIAICSTTLLLPYMASHYLCNFSA